MIKIENTMVVGWEPAIRGMRNPMNSWDKSDSGQGCRFKFDIDEEIARLGVGVCRLCEHQRTCVIPEEDGTEFIIGENDLTLMKKLCKGGSDDRKFLRMIVVYVDIVAPLYWWKEFDTYKVGTVANSCSTMHKIHLRDLTMDDFSYERMTEGSRVELAYNVDAINVYRHIYVNWDDISHDKKDAMGVKSKEDAWWQMIQLLSTSYNQLRTVMLNYEVLRNMYHARKNHKLTEWHDFCAWVKALPYAEDLITGGEK